MRKLNGKYQIEGQITKADGTPLPEDEPLIIFRGKDQLLPDLLVRYKELCAMAGSPEDHLKDLDAQITAVEQWQSENPDKVKIPD